jgi:eukaryotic-like serine/threonine-protein kinase
VSDQPSAQLVARYCDGDELAAAALFERYAGRLARLAASRLSRKLARRTDPDDVVQSAFRSFFVRVRDGRLAVGTEDRLWTLLAPIALHKLYRHVRHHRAERRSIDAEEMPSGSGLTAAVLARDPSPAEAATLADELEAMLWKLDPWSRRVFELRLSGASLAEIAIETGRSERTVRRAIGRIRSMALEHSRAREPEAAGWPNQDPTVRPTSPPAVLYSEYRLKQLIGAGGVGKVYRATVRGSGDEVAIKFLRKSFHDDADAIARFRAEAAVVAGLDHPGIVPIHGIGQTTSGLWFMVMELVAGSDLSQIAKQRAVSQVEAIHWIAEACAAIAHIHRRQIIHCDLKPSNLLLGTDGRIRVTDFGFARSLFSKPQGVAGTASFMAPEQVSSSWGSIGPWTDVYGLGAVLYWLLTGHAPFEGHNAEDLLARVVSAEGVRPPHLQRPSVPEQLNSVCLKCLAKGPDDRFNSAQALGHALQQAAR